MRKAVGSLKVERGEIAKENEEIRRQAKENEEIRREADTDDSDSDSDSLTFA